MSYQSQVVNHPLYQDFSHLRHADNLSLGEITELQGLILRTAESVGPHLDRVRCTFQQYTEHDLRHLLNIATHIHDFLPRSNGQIELNALELTLLWLAILLHDVGMFVDDGEKQEIEKSADYLQFLRLQRDRQAAARQAAKRGDTVFAQRIEDAIFAEFIRRHHAVRVRGYLQKHFVVDGKSQLKFLGADLIPDLGNLCESHNWGVRQSRDSRQPRHCVVALEEGDCIGRTPLNHRYLACCLRLGDILDFDRSRTPLSAYHAIHFSEALSAEEWRKHLSIRGNPITEHQVAYIADCELPADYVAVQCFLDWVDHELQECTRLFPKSVDATKSRYAFNLSPVVDRTGIRMKDPRFVAGGFRFQLEYDQIMRLLMDKSLYPDETLFLRELLQNALDACRYQQARAKEQDLGDKYIPRIQVTDLSQQLRTATEGPKIIFQDNGVGMSLEQVEHYFMRVGKSYYKSPEFQAERERLQEHGIQLEACSQFGIGFLSCFLGGDRIEVETYQYGSEPLKITIEGPAKYFVIERLERPHDENRRFVSPKKATDDTPPQYSGTKVTVHLRDGWRKSKKANDDDTDLIYRTLDAVAVNQEYPLLVRSGAIIPDHLRTITARRWDTTVPKRSTVASGQVEEILAPYLFADSFSLSDFDPSLRGRGVLWFLNRDHQPALQLGDLRVSRGQICESKVVRAGRGLAYRCMNSENRVQREITTLLKSQVEPGIVAEQISRSFDKPWSFFCGTDELTHAIVHSRLWLQEISEKKFKHVLESDWYHSGSAIPMLAQGDRAKLISLWRSMGVPNGLSDVQIRSGYRFALYGIECPGGFQTWDAAAGFARRHNWLPDGADAQIDGYGSHAPAPAASRLFIPYERSHEIQITVARAFLGQAQRRWQEHRTDPEWSDWFGKFLTSWRSDLVFVALTPEERQRWWNGYSMGITWTPTDCGVFAVLLCDEFERRVLSRDADGGSPFRMPSNAIPREHIERAAKKSRVPDEEIDRRMAALSDAMGWDITQGRPAS